MEIKLNKTELHDKEVLEMILQFFYESRYIDSAKLLESKANIIYDQNEIQQLKLLLKNHQYDESFRFLENSNFENQQKAEVLKILKSRKFIELVKEDNKKKEALEFLRSEICPLFNQSASNLNKFSILLFNKEKDSLEKLLNQNFTEINSDECLINKIQSMLCLSLDSNGNRILPNSRLENMLNSYMYSNESLDIMDIDEEYNPNPNPYFIPNNRQIINLYKNFSSNYIIEKHDDEVWHLDLSSSSKYLATCSRNGMISIFSLSYSDNKMCIDCISYFQSHKKYVTSIQWSKSEKFILSSSADKSIKLWSPFEAKCLKTFLLHTDIVTSVRWLNEETFVSGSIDKKIIVCTTGNRVLCSELFFRVRKVLFSEALNFLVIIPASMNDIIIYDHKTYREIHRITELDPIISSNLSIRDKGRYLITNLSKVNSSINLYDLTNNFKLVNKFYGHTQEQYTIECNFAGENDEYIICGSEDASIYLWHRSSSISISVIKGHTGSVNNCFLSLHGQENVPFIFSVSDDFTLRVWTDKSGKSAKSKKEVKFQDLTCLKKGTNNNWIGKEVNEVNGITSASSNHRHIMEICNVVENESNASFSSDNERGLDHSEESD